MEAGIATTYLKKKKNQSEERSNEEGKMGGKMVAGCERKYFVYNGFDMNPKLVIIQSRKR
jgi:hypothetical protein